MINSANKIWIETLSDLIYGTKHKTISIKGALADTGMAYEILNHKVTMDMKYPRVTIAARKLNLRYSKMEALMILVGANRLDFHPIIQRTLEKWSDDDIFIRHAYGPKIIDQLPYILQCFKYDPNTRRAVINVWRDSPGQSKDTTCLVNLQLLMRDNKLHCIANMRSSDAWLGMPNDLASYSYVVEGIRHMINKYTESNFELGLMYANAGSRHLYTDQIDKVENVLSQSALNLEDISIPDFKNYDELCEWLGDLPE